MVATRKVDYMAPVEVGDHIAGLRAMRVHEKDQLKAKVANRRRPMFVLAFFAIGWGVLQLMLIAETNETFCYISIGMYIFVLICAMTVRQINKPVIQAIQEGVVMEFTAECTNAGPGSKAVGPILVSVPYGYESLFEDGKLVTVGYIPETYFVVSVNGLDLGKPLDARALTPIEPLVRGKLAVWEDVGAPQTAASAAQAAAYAAAAPGSRSRGKQSHTPFGYLGAAQANPAPQPQAPEQNYVFFKKYQPPVKEPAQAAPPPPVDDIVIETPRRYGTVPAQAPSQGQIVNKTVTVTRTADGKTQVQTTEVVKTVGPTAPTPAPVVEAPKPVSLPKAPEPKNEPINKEVYCPYHGTKTELRSGKLWCTDCNNYLDASPEYCPYHGCRTEPKDGKTYCPRCDAMVEPLERAV